MLAAVLIIAATALALLLNLLLNDRLNVPFRRLLVALVVALLAAAGAATALGSSVSGRGHAVVVLLALVLAAAGGSQVTTAVFQTVDEQEDPPEVAGAEVAERSLRAAGQVLRGGLWIGVLERLAVFATLVGRWPEGIAVVLAVKGLGRYPELRAGQRPGLAERFIVGTLVSVLWAGLCVYASTGPALG